MAFDLDSAMAVDAGGPEVFARLYGAAAKRAAMQIGVDPKLLLAQWGHETGWGRSIVPGTNNLGNIKDFSGAGVAATDNATGSRDRYRKFASPDDFADAYANLVRARYPGAVGAGGNAGKFTAGLKGYAQDRGYAGKIAAALQTVGKALGSVIPSAAAAEVPPAPAAAGFDLGSARPEGDAAAPAGAAGFDLASAKPVVDEAAAGRKTPMQLRSDPSFLDVAAARASSFGHGIKDPVTGGAQLLTHVLPDSVVAAGNRLNNWLAKYGLVSELPKGGLDEAIRQDEAELGARRRDAGLAGADWMRVGGNIVSPVNAALPAGAPKAASLLGKAAVTAGQGAVSGALAPVTNALADGGDYWSAKAKQIAAAAATGAAVPIVGSAAARVVSPKVSPEVRQLAEAGVSMTPGQMVGGAARKFEEKMGSVPFVGDIIKSAERRGIKDFDRAAIDKALEPIGVKLPKGMTAGHDAIDFAGEAIGDKYDKLVPKLTGRVDKKFVQELAAVRNLGASGLPADKAQQLDRIIDKEVLGRFGAKGGATGQTLKQIESKLGGMAASMRRSGDYDVRNMGDAVATIQKSLRDMLERNNPKYAAELKKVNSAYAQYLRVQTAAARQGAREGIFTPAQLRSAVRQLDASKAKSAFAKGKAGMQDFAEAGTKVLSNNVPDSGTAGRAMAGALALGAPGLWNPLFALGMGAAPLYTPWGQKAAQLALTARPQGANALANYVRNNSPAIAAGVIPLSRLPMLLQGEAPQQ